jgi:putative ABC transport system permease protein
MPAFILLTVMTALRILSRNRLRAGLTMLGIVIGVGAVIAMVSIGQGAPARRCRRRWPAWGRM